MAKTSCSLLGMLRDAWRWLASGAEPVEPAVTALDEWRTEFRWRTTPVTVDRRRECVLRGGRVLARFADIRAVVVKHVRDDDAPDSWEVSLDAGVLSSIELGTTRDDVEASIAAARIATLLGAEVRASALHRR